MNTLITQVQRRLMYLSSPEEQRRALYLVAINLLMMFGSVLFYLYTSFYIDQLLPITLNVALNLTIVVLILNKRYQLGVRLFVLLQPGLGFITLPMLDLNAMAYLIPSYLAVSLFIRDQRTIVAYGLSLGVGIAITGFVTSGIPRYAALIHADLFLFLFMTIIMITMMALVARADRAQIHQQSRAIETSEQQLRSILENFPGLILVYDQNLNLITFRAAPTVVPPSLITPIVGSPIKDHFTPAQFPMIMSQMERVAALGRPVSFELPGWEEHRWYEVSAAPVVERGRVRRTVLIALEITRRKRAEESQRSTARDLQDFAYIISHDLKAPLRGIITVAGWLVEDYADKFDDKGRELVDMLQGRVRIMDAMINGVLEYSRIGRQETIQPVDVSEVIREIETSIVPHDRACLIIETPLPTIYSDPTRVRQIFQNLIDNAIKYGDKPMTEIRIGAVQLPFGWSFSVSDNGRGIPEQFHERVFQVFQTLAPRDSESSTGIGLAILKRIVDYYGGAVHLSSEVGKGSTFTITLPEVHPSSASSS